MISVQKKLRLQEKLIKNAEVNMGTRKYNYLTLESLIYECLKEDIHFQFDALIPEEKGQNSLDFYMVIEVFENDTSLYTCHILIPYIPVKNMQEVGSMMTYARRYAILMALGLQPKNEDDDCISTVTDDKPNIHVKQVVVDVANNVKYIHRDDSPIHSRNK